MSSFIVSARKYRPSNFDELLGQSHVSKTLKNAMTSDRLAHAFLFCGPRGVGKTSCARILAKTINCQNRGEKAEACGSCESCLNFDNNASFNIIELDAASNNSVENIRTLMEQVRYAPQKGSHKVFIIDEVHMLSVSAFNAFLKTLEEPPEHVIFILATTEKNKILPTILSRCQVFDFKRIQIGDMVDQMKQISQDSSINIEEEALRVIASKADGAMRDALSIYDRMASLGGETISYQMVIDQLNVLDYQYYLKMVDAMIAGDNAVMLNLVEEIVNRGFDLHELILGVSQHFRRLMLMSVPGVSGLAELSSEKLPVFQQQASKSEAKYWLNAMNFSNECELNYRNSRNKRVHVELSLFKIARILEPKNSTSTNEVKKKPSLALDSVPNEELTEDVSSTAEIVGEVGEIPKLEESTVQIKEESSKELQPIVTEEVASAENIIPLVDQGPSLAEDVELEQEASPPKSMNERELNETPPPAESKTEKSVSIGMSSLMSLNDFESTLELDDNSKQEESIEINRVEEIWQNYKETNAANQLRVMMDQTSLKIEDSSLIFCVPSELIKSRIQEEKEILDELRRYIGTNYKMQFVIEIPEGYEAEPVERLPVTLDEKLKFFVEQNPALLDMMKELSLKPKD